MQVEFTISLNLLFKEAMTDMGGKGTIIYPNASTKQYVTLSICVTVYQRRGTALQIFDINGFERMIELLLLISDFIVRSTEYSYRWSNTKEFIKT